MPRSPWRVLALACALLIVPLSGVAAAHAERDTAFPAGTNEVPSYQVDGPTLVVCKDDTPERLAALPEALRERNEALLDACQFEHIQEAIDAVTEQESRILVMPGLYREEPSYELTPECEELANKGPEDENRNNIGPVPISPGEDSGDNSPGTPVYSYEEQARCPHAQNLIGLFGDTNDDGTCDNALCGIQIEGTGARPEQVIVDGAYKHLNGIRADRVDGVYLYNLTVQRFEFNAVYALESDGFVFEEVVTRWNDEYGFLSFAVDHGLYENCEGYGNGDSVVYPGSASDLNQGAGLLENNEGLRFATEIRGCRAHHSTLGYSGTAGNSVHSHHNEFDHNMAGMAMDSLFPDHPGLPQDHAYVHDNLIHSNNENYYRYIYEGGCEGPFGDRDYDEGVVCPVVPLPVGSGIVLAGGNANLFENNRMYDNWRQGVMQFFVPATVRGEDDPAKQFDTSNFNTYRANQMGANPNGSAQPNGVDFWWDGEGEGNCWEDNTTPIGDVTYSVNDASVPEFPGCNPRPPFSPAVTVVTEAGCAEYSRDENPDPEGCDWMQSPSPPENRQPAAPTLQRLAGEDRVTTAILAAREGYPDRAETVVLSRSDVFADALAGAPLGDFLGGPVLLTGRDALSPETAAEIERLGATRVVLLGGLSALPSEVEEAVRDLGVADVQRVAGPDRFSTAVEIARLIGGANAYIAKAVDEDPNRAWPDALGASAVAAHQQRPVLLTGSDALPDVTRDFLAEGDITDVRIVGGVQAISEDIEAELDGLLADVDRVFGKDRFGTSLALAEVAVQAGADPTELWLATGANWPDALVAGAPAAVDEGVLLLVDPKELTDDSPARQWLAEHTGVLENIRILGGEAAISGGVANAVSKETGAEQGDARGDRSNGTIVSSGEFAVYDGAPSAYESLEGSAVMRRTVEGTTRVEVLVNGAPGDTLLPAHVHDGPCPTGANGGLGAPDEAGPHFRFDPDGGDMPPNEIHPAVATDAAGVGQGRATAFAIAGPKAQSVNLHDPNGDMVACATLDGGVPAEGTPLEMAAFMGLPGDTLPFETATVLAAMVLLGAGVALRRTRRPSVPVAA